MSNAVIGALRVTLGLDTAQFETNAKKAGDQADAFSSRLKVGLAAAAAAATVAFAAISAGVRDALNEADQMGQTAQKIGIPVEELSKLSYAANLSDVSMGTLQTSVKKLSTLMSEAASGNKGAAQTLASVGVSATDASGKIRPASAVIAQLSDLFSKMPDSAEKTALAVKLFGKSGLEMIPFLNSGRQSIEELMNEARQLGLVISTETAAAANNFNDNLDRLSSVARGFSVQLAATLAPALEMITTGLVEVAKGAVFALQQLPNISGEIAVFASAMALAFSPVIIQAINAAAVAIGVTLLGAIRAVTAAALANPLGLIAAGLAVAAVAIYRFRDDIASAIGVDVVGVVKSAANLIINSFRAAFEDIKFAWAAFPDIIGAAVIGAVNAVVAGVQTMISKAVGLLNGFVEKANSVLSTIGADIPKIPLPDFSGEAIPNDYAKRLSAAVADRNKAIADIMASDPVGDLSTAMTGAFKSSADAMKEWNEELARVGDQLENTAGKAAKASKAVKDPWEGLRTVTSQTKDAMKNMQSSAETIATTLGSGIADLIKGTKSWGDVALAVVAQIANSWISSQSFGGGGFGSVIKGLLGGLTGFAQGGSIMPGGTGGIDSQVVAFKKSPSEQVDIYKPGQKRSSGGGGMVLYQTINAPNANLATVVELKKTVEDLNKNFNRRAVAANKQYQTRGTV